jgi:hypothetical protein
MDVPLDGKELFQAIEEIFPVFIVSEYFSTLDPPDHDMAQNVGCV